MQILNSFTTSVEKALGEIEPKWRSYDGLIVCGSHSPYEPEGLIEAIKQARETNLPTLLICAGYQLGAIEYARNVLGIKDATSEEFSKTGTFVIKKRAEFKVGLHEGETWWSNYEVAIDWPIPNNFIAVAFHPEYQSTRDKPHHLLIKFLELCKQK